MMLPAFDPNAVSPTILWAVGIAILFLAVVVFARFSVGNMIFGGSFIARPLLNYSEYKLFGYLHRHIASVFGPDARLMCQVSYGEFLKSKSIAKFRKINAKRADFVVVDGSFNVLAVIEYQGKGHYGNSFLDRLDADKRDRTKRRALKSAGIPLFEVPPQFSHSSLAELLSFA